MDYPESVPSVWDELTDRAIADTLSAGPPAGKRRNRVVFDFVRHLTEHPRRQECSARDLEPYLHRWYQACAEHILTPQGTPLAYDEVCVYFNDLWDNGLVLTSAGNQWTQAVQNAHIIMVNHPELDDLPPRLRTLGAIMAVLAVRAKHAQFFVTQAQAGSILAGVEGTDAGTRYLGHCAIGMLIDRGIIAKSGTAKPHKATRYVYCSMVSAEDTQATVPAPSAAAPVETPQPGMPTDVEFAAAKQRFIEEWTQAKGQPPTEEELQTWCAPPSEWREND